MSLTTFIYGLYDPFTNQIRYVGKSNNPNYRLKSHLRDKAKTHKCNWIKTVINKGSKPIVKILEEIPINEWKSKEIEYIAKFPNLTNFTSGGEGGITFTVNPMLGKTHTAEAKAKISATHKGTKLSNDHKKKIGLSLIGKMTKEKNPVAKKYTVKFMNGSEKIYYGQTVYAYSDLKLSKTTFYEFVKGKRSNYKGIKSINC